MKNIFRSSSFLHPLKNLYERFRYGAGCCDIFNLDYYLAKKILKPLKVFRQDVCSYPGNFNSIKEWEDILDEMIFAFDYTVNEDSYDFDNWREYDDRQSKGYKLFGEYYGHLWK